MYVSLSYLERFSTASHAIFYQVFFFVVLYMFVIQTGISVLPLEAVPFLSKQMIYETLTIFPNFNLKLAKLSLLQQCVYTLFLRDIFLSNTTLKLAKNQAKAKQHPEVELLLSETYLLCSSRCHPKIIGDILKMCKNKCVYFNRII